MNPVRGKIIFVSGASKGIGAATAALLAEQGAVVYCAARTEALLRAQVDGLVDQGLRAHALPLDVADHQAMATAFNYILQQEQRLDILINNAAIIDPVAHLEDSDPVAWSRAVDINLKGVYYGIRYALPVMKRQGSGTIISLSSGAATRPLEGWSHYCASKAGVLSLTQCADKEARDSGVRVVGLSPGTVATDMQTIIKESGINPVSRLDWSDHLSVQAVALAVLALCGSLADRWRGQDFSLKTPQGRAAVRACLANLEPLCADQPG